jgi:hypothetical protein
MSEWSAGRERGWSGMSVSPGRTMNDIRSLNWQFVVPQQPDSFLFLPIDSESVPGATTPNGIGGLEDALHRGPFSAVAAPDLAAWLEPGQKSRPASLLGRLADAVSPGGWLYVGFPNRPFPRRPTAPGALRMRTAIKVVRRRGFTDIRTFLPFPDQRCPAYLISAEPRAPLGYFLARLVFPYVTDPQDAPRRQRQIMRMRNAALASPHPIRVRFAPAGALVARRAG